MITKRIWTKQHRGTLYTKNICRREGWFLLGIIPLYIRDLELRNT